MKRRAFMAAMAAASVMSNAAFAQRPGGGLPRVVIVAISDPLDQMSLTGTPYWRAFLEEFERLGFRNGENVEIIRVSGSGRESEFDQIAYELIELQPDVLFGGGGRGMRGLIKAGATMPIVGLTGDPLRNGFVQNMSRPEANITGVSVDAGADWFGKHVQFARELMPNARRLGHVKNRIFFDPPNPPTEAVRRAASSLGFELVEVPLDGPITEATYQQVFATLAREGADVTFIAGGGENRTFAPTIAEIALDVRMPTISRFREFADAGGLLSYGVSYPDLYRDAANYVAKILQGTPISELPWQQPEKFDLVINLRTAHALGITIPPKLLIQATELIE